MNKDNLLLTGGIGLVLVMMIGFPLVEAHMVREQQLRQYHKIYDACIADGQKPYYCDSLASK